METYKDIPVMSFAGAADWQSWLKENYELQGGIWIKIAKKGSGVKSINHTQALGVALCWGWIDGQAKSIDETFYLQKFTPRRQRSIWSKINIAKVEELTAQGLMQEPGLAAVEAAKADGRWAAAYDSPKNSTVPPELAEAFDKNPKAEAFFNTLNKANQYAATWRVATAKTAAGKSRRIEKIIAMLNEGKTFH